MKTISMPITIPVYSFIIDIQTATHEDMHLQELKTYMVKGWLHKKKEIAQDIRQYWSLKNELAV